MRLIILDRDGVINEDSDEYIKSPSEWKPIRGSLEAIARLHHAGWRVVVATNQSGIARGLFDLDTLARIHKAMHKRVVETGGLIDAVFFCPHGPEDNCNCRKPRPGMLLDIAERLRIDLAEVPSVGDSLRDIQAAQAAGAQPVLVKTGKGFGTVSNPDLDLQVPVYEDLYSAVDALLKSTHHQSGNQGIQA
ncbi:MAG TPA: D-glycero-beta-D-manno-heptose 1,7-bisphosphate 7-phosphatase [Gammaproteobacteria bacterium]|nr:D-glycero-beta-D-manno-heptose 1,7-bisphosphate 7-phosphatase [Gammaproteobacteria bacterium]